MSLKNTHKVDIKGVLKENPHRVDMKGIIFGNIKIQDRYCTHNENPFRNIIQLSSLFQFIFTGKKIIALYYKAILFKDH